MVKHTQTIRRLLPAKCLSVFDQLVGLALKGLKTVCLEEGDIFNVFSELEESRVTLIDSLVGKLE